MQCKLGALATAPRLQVQLHRVGIEGQNVMVTSTPWEADRRVFAGS